MAGTRRLVRYAGAALLGLLGALALGSCGGGDGVAVGTGTITRSLPSVPAVTESVTVTNAGPGVTETVTLTETAPSVTETAPTATETVTVTETAPAATTTVPSVTISETVTVTTAEGVSAAAAAAAAAAGSADDGLTSSEWGWVAFGVLAAAVLIGGIVMWLRRRAAAKTA